MEWPTDSHCHATGDAVYSSCHYLNHYIELSNLSCKMAPLTSFPLSQTVEVYHYTTESMKTFKEFDSGAYNQPLTYLPSVCPYSIVSTGHHWKMFVNTYSKTLSHGGRALATILATVSFLGTSNFTILHSNTHLPYHHHVCFFHMLLLGLLDIATPPPSMMEH